MQIEKINNIQFTRTHLPQLNKNKINNSTNPIADYNPPYYQDYNITFGARLFRTPANFFEQDFNRNGMPQTMKDYLFDDYEDRQNMPPAQMMKLVFSDLNGVQNLEQVKLVYPEEKLFANLKDKPAIKSRTGVLAEIDLMKQEDKSLFKNGQDNLGLYILKKIYIEGKTLKEINKDFQKDISVHYKGLSPIDYRTLSAFGIKYPNTAFWNSFVATREDFPYVYKPRKAIDSRIQHKENSVQKSAVKSEPVKKKFDNVKDWEIDKLSDALISGKGNLEETKKQLKKRNIKDGIKDSFVTKYLGEINAIVLEKVHASEEMKDFWENYENLTASQKTKLEDYWNSDPFIKTQRSTAMKDTIKLFMDAYGADGNNEEFQDLLDYAHSIKPNRIARQKEHDRIQFEYEELFASLPSDEEVVVQEKIQDKPDIDPDALLRELAIKNGAKVYQFDSPDGNKITFVLKIDEEFGNALRQEIKLLPRGFVNKYLNFMLKSPLASEDYKESIALLSKVPDYAKSKFMPPDVYRKISAEINRDFNTAYPQLLRANDIAFAEQILTGLPDKYAELLLLDTQRLLSFATDTLHIDEWSPKERQDLERNYADYLLPIKKSNEINRVYSELISYLERMDLQKSIPSQYDYQCEILRLLAANIQAYPNIKSRVSKDLKSTQFVDKYGGSAKLLLKPDVSQAIKDVQCTLMLEDLLSNHANIMSCSLACDIDNIRTYINEPVLRQVLLEKYMRIISS